MCIRLLRFARTTGRAPFATLSIIIAIFTAAGVDGQTQTVDLAMLANNPSNQRCVPVGQQMRFALSVSSNGGAAHNVFVRDKLPVGTSFVASLSSPGCSASCPDTVTCYQASLQGTWDLQVGIHVDYVPDQTFSNLVNMAAVYGDELDSNQQNNFLASPAIQARVNPPPLDCLSIIALQPGTYVSSGNQPLGVFGSGFQSGATVKVGPTSLGAAGFVSTGQLNSSSPALPLGQYDVIVTNPDGGIATLIGGYIVSDPVPTGFQSLTPCRVFDTRDSSGSPAMAASSVRVFPVGGRCGVPASAKAVALNITVVPSASGNLSLFPGNLAPNLASFLTFDAGNVRANNGQYPLSTDGAGTIGIANNSQGTVDVILDAFGYLQ